MNTVMAYQEILKADLLELYTLQKVINDKIEEKEKYLNRNTINN